MPRPQAPRIDIQRWQAGGWAAEADAVAAEEPLQILVNGEEWAVVMRTPGDDVELALGLLHAERIVASLAEIASVHISAEAGEVESALVVADLLESNAVDVRRAGDALDRKLPRRTFASSSACGICGATAVDELALDLAPLPVDARFEASLLPRLAHLLRGTQGVFDQTGGLHAAGLFTAAGELVVAREDVGRHNAVDKVAGWALLRSGLPLSGHVLAVSGRVGFEVAQKAVAAGIPAVVAVGAPSSLAVQVARRFDLTLVGFLRDDRFNVYSGEGRLLPVDYAVSRG